MSADAAALFSAFVDFGLLSTLEAAEAAFLEVVSFFALARAGTGAGIPEEERIANRAGAEFCVPRDMLHAFIARKAPFFSERDLLGFANTMSVHPGLVAGQLQHVTGRYDRFRSHLVKVRQYIAPSAIVDGWGDVAPVDLQ